MLESELFGHVKGAFTGAVADRPGRFELAGKGTLFLDEIAEIPLDLQAKLLRVLQERTFERVGDAKPMPLDARVDRGDPPRPRRRWSRRGTFREDLYYRLRVVEIALPPLRERASDIPILVEGLLAKINRDLGKDVRYVTPAALARLAAYPWPGNVRELENTLTRAVVLAKTDVLDETLLPLGAAAAATAPTRGRRRGRARRRCARSSAATSPACSRTPSGTSAGRARSSTSAGRRSIARSRSTACASEEPPRDRRPDPARDRRDRRRVRLRS